ncbi:protein INO4 [Kluyveromyces marxianus]|uniref:Protein INO4 n=1 Tax=Kluyveromyces marxianus TaxID=4911 RepID=A0ABX6F2D9_KLUMA|nr:protein INO4 [Kluyveromyces marxianus]
MSIGQNRLNTNDGKTKSERKSRTKFDPAEQRYKHVSCEKNRRSSIRCSYDKLVDLVPGLTDKERRSEWKIYVKKHLSQADIIYYGCMLVMSTFGRN